MPRKGLGRHPQSEETRMADVINPQAADAVTFANVKTVAETLAAANANLAQMAANAAGLAIQNAVANQANQSALSNAATAQAINLLLNVDPSQAVSENKLLTGNDVAATISSLLAAINAGQQGVKSAGNTPPVTP
jgi:L-alanine-DL-glutamate epimerase-like enolase superfamily enzyme